MPVSLSRRRWRANSLRFFAADRGIERAGAAAARREQRALVSAQARDASAPPRDRIGERDRDRPMLNQVRYHHELRQVRIIGDVVEKRRDTGWSASRSTSKVPSGP